MLLCYRTLSKYKLNRSKVQATLDDFRASADDPIPVFLRKAISFIEKEGLDAEGLYRVPGNRAHVDLLFQKFDEDHLVDIDELDIAVNAVATAVKDFFFKRLPPILGQDHMSDLESISSKNRNESIRFTELICCALSSRSLGFFNGFWALTYTCLFQSFWF